MNRLIAENIDAMEGYTPGEQPKFDDIVKLNTNENPYPPSPAVAEALARFDTARLRRYSDPLAVAVRTRIAEIHGCPLECVFAGNGSDEVLSLAVRCFTHDTGAVGCFNPTYSLYPVLAEIRNVKCVETPLGPGFSWRTPDPGFKPDLMFITNPNAPTGVMYPKEEVARFCADFEGTVFIDEAYVDFATGNCMDLATAPGNKNVIVSRTLSKSFSLAGLRFGYCIGPAELIEAMYKAKDSYNLDAITQSLALAALVDLDYMCANAAKIKASRTLLSRELAARGWTMTPSETNFIFARPPKNNAAEIFTALKKRHVFVRYFPAPLTREYIRVTIGTPAENARLLAELDALA